MESRIKSTIMQLLLWIVNEDYDAIEKFTLGEGLSGGLIRQAVSDYGRTLVMPPPNSLDNIDAIEIAGANPKAWSVRVDLWTAEEGRSDLSLECTLLDKPGDLLGIELDGLHVL